MFIESIPEATASGPVAQMYDADRERLGYVANYTRAFAHRPAVYAAWQQLSSAIRQSMDERAYELVTVAAARRLRSSYCMLAHGEILAGRILPPDAVRGIATGDDHAGLDAAEVAAMDLVEKIVDDATSVTAADVDGLRQLGMSDPEILDVVLAAAARCFFSKVLDAVGAQADPAFAGLDPALRDALTVGRPIAPGDVSDPAAGTPAARRPAQPRRG
ncbi:hypothetical protein GCM10009609_75940 [Pseudonocardia aurantiaca]|uniref:Carboxymuconolactone decarboxylase family protein n=1 Tax=Pseudonocardia aurantiaca TaxID=75290 RepID=A0ABW4FVM6_9PSEU